MTPVRKAISVEIFLSKGPVGPFCSNVFTNFVGHGAATLLFLLCISLRTTEVDTCVKWLQHVVLFRYGFH